MDKIKEIKAILNHYYSNDIETDEINPDYDESFSAQDALDEIVQIIING